MKHAVLEQKDLKERPLEGSHCDNIPFTLATEPKSIQYITASSMPYSLPSESTCTVPDLIDMAFESLGLVDVSISMGTAECKVWYHHMKEKTQLGGNLDHHP